MDSTPREPDDVQQTLKHYDQRISDLERAVQELKAERTAVSQAPAQTPQGQPAYQHAEYQPEGSDPIAPFAENRDTAANPDGTAQTTITAAQPPALSREQVEQSGQTGGTTTRKNAQEKQESGGMPVVMPLIIAALTWFFSDSFMLGALAGVVSSFIMRAIMGSKVVQSAKKDADAQAGAPKLDTTGGATPTRPPRLPRIKSDLEQSIGRYWYLWTGVCLLVVGLGYGLMLAYEQVGPLVKILSWFAGAAALVAVGEYAHKKMDFKAFGLSLVGGGYAVGYFTVYAMQNIASVKIIDSVVVDSILLLALAAGCMLHSLYRKSESIAMLSALLAFATLSLSTVTGLTLVAAGLMVVGLAAVIVRMRWLNVYLASTIGTYVTFAFFTQPQIAASVAGLPGLLLSAAFLAAYWAAFSAVFFLIGKPEETAKERAYGLGVSAVNAVAFVAMGLSAMGGEFADWRYLFLLVAGALYGAFALLAHQKRLFAAEIFFALVGLMLGTAAIPLWLDATAVSAVWLLEVPLLVIAGLALKQPTFRAFAGALTVVAGARLLMLDLVFGSTHTLTVFGWALSWPVLIGVTGVFAFALAAAAYKHPTLKAAQHKIEEPIAYHFYLVVASAVAWMIPAVAAGADSQCLWFAAEAAVLLSFAVRSKDRIAELLATVFFATSGATLLLNHASVSTWATVLNLAAFFGVSAYYKLVAPRRQDSVGYQLHHGYVIGAIALTWALTALNTADFSKMALWLVLESALVVAAGFALRDGVLRQLGSLGMAASYVAVIAAFSAWTWATTLPVVAAFYALSFVYRYTPLKNAQRPGTFADAVFALGSEERSVIRFAFSIMGTLLLFAATGKLVPDHLHLWWAAEAAAITAVGFVIGDREWRYIGAAGVAATTFTLAIAYPSWTWLSAMPVAALLFSVSLAYRLLPLKDSLGDDSLINRHLPKFENEGELLSAAHTVVGALLTTTALYVLLAWQWLAVAWSLEAIILLTAGVKLNDKVFRYSAHAIFALMLGKIILWDLRGADQVVRVVSIIIAGIVSIGAAWIFTRFEKKLKDEDAARGVQRNLTEHAPGDEDAGENQH